MISPLRKYAVPVNVDTGNSEFPGNNKHKPQTFSFLPRR